MPNPALGERMCTARLRAGLTLEAVGKALAHCRKHKRPFSAQAVQQWEKGKTEPSSAALAAFAKLTQVNVNWLVTGIVVNDVDGKAEFGTSARGGRVVPKISAADAITLPISYKTEEHVHTHFACSDKAFVIDVFDNRNADEFLADIHRIVIDPAVRPVPGDMVLARVDGEPVFGKFTRKKGVEIEALNKDWHAERLVESRGDRVIGVMTEHAKPRRR